MRELFSSLCKIFNNQESLKSQTGTTDDHRRIEGARKFTVKTKYKKDYKILQ
jgi:hypothetical protein